MLKTTISTSKFLTKKQKSRQIKFKLKKMTTKNRTIKALIFKKLKNISEIKWITYRPTIK